MYKITKVAPSHISDEDIVVDIGSSQTEVGAIEILRNHLLNMNMAILDVPHVPRIIRDNAERNIERNSDLSFEIREDGVVYIDGEGPEMDYYKITAQ